MKKYNKVLILIILPLLSTAMFIIYLNNRASNVRAYGHITVDLGVPSGDPIFTVSNFLPGDCEMKVITVTNNDTMPTELAVRSANETQTNNLPDALTIEISENGNVLYQQSVAQFFTDSNGLDGIPLSLVNSAETKTYTFNVCFDQEAGNEYQNGTTLFDLIFGEVISPIQLPAECIHLRGIITQKIEGTTAKDRIRGTSANELIVGNGGEDKLDGAGGTDCIVGGPSNDKLDGGQGTDVIVAGEGNDKVDGSQGEDTIYGNGGNDTIKGGSSNDTIYGGEGNDDIDGGSGDDKIYGESGDDELDGGSGKDNLSGGADTDKLSGGPSSDTCIEGEILKSCEL